MNQLDNDTHVSSDYSSINDIYKNTAKVVVCRWDISILKDCKGSVYYLWIYYTAIILYSALLTLSLVLLIYKIFLKKSSFWNDRMIEPIIGFLIWLGLHGLCKYLYYLYYKMFLRKDYFD
jgi:hypothetical protein